MQCALWSLAALLQPTLERHPVPKTLWVTGCSLKQSLLGNLQDWALEIPFGRCCLQCLLGVLQKLWPLSEVRFLMGGRAVWTRTEGGCWNLHVPAKRRGFFWGGGREVLDVCELPTMCSHLVWCYMLAGGGGQGSRKIRSTGPMPVPYMQRPAPVQWTGLVVLVSCRDWLQIWPVLQCFPHVVFISITCSACCFLHRS